MPCTDVKGVTSELKDELAFIKKCYWKEKEIDCKAIFQKRPTNRGMCCSFNMKRADNFMKSSKYKNAIALQQSKDSNRGFESNGIVVKNTQWFIGNNEPKAEPGIEKGLTLVVDSHSNRLSSASVFDNFRGFPIIIEDNQKFPTTSFSGKRVRPGFENNIEVSAFSLEARDEIRKYEPDQRKCYFPDEHNLKMHTYYSRSSCIFECKLEFAAKCLTTCHEYGQTCNCGNYDVITDDDLKAGNACIPWFYPMQDKETGKFCNPWNTEKFKEIMKNQIPKGLCDKCLPDCSNVEYETTMTSAELQACDVTTTGSTGLLCNLLNGTINPAPWVNIAQNEYIVSNEEIPWFLDSTASKKRILQGSLFKPFFKKSTRFSDKRTRNQKEGTGLFPLDIEKNPEYNAFEKDIGIINVFFSKKEVPNFVTKNRLSTADFMYQIGGSLGFVMGVSLISFIEIVYWLCFRILGNLGNMIWRKFEMIIRMF